MENPFTEQEQRFVLAEIIKTSSIPLDKLINLLAENNVTIPNYFQMQVPHGRNLGECMHTFDVLRQRVHQMPHVPIPQFQAPPQNKRKSGSELEIGGNDQVRKRRPSGIDTTTSAQRSIQPKPASNGSPVTFATPFSGSTPGPAKKRGRPSKSEIAQRQAEEIARGMIIETLGTPRSSLPLPLDSPSGINVNLGNIPTFASINTGGSGPEGSTLIPSGDQGDSSKKKGGRPKAKSTKAPGTGEANLSIMAVPFLQQTQHSPRFEPQHNFSLPQYNRPTYQTGSPMQSDRQIQQQMQFNVQPDTTGHQMHASGEANVKSGNQQEMQFEGTAVSVQEPNKLAAEHKEDPRSDI